MTTDEVITLAQRSFRIVATECTEWFSRRAEDLGERVEPAPLSPLPR